MAAASFAAGSPGSTPQRLAPTFTSTSTSSLTPAARAAASSAATLPASSAHTAMRARFASAARRFSFVAPTTSFAISTSGTPPSTIASASLTFWQHTPTAPRFIWRNAISGHLWLFACGRIAIFLPASEASMRSRLRSNASRSRISAGVSTSASGMPISAGR